MRRGNARDHRPTVIVAALGSAFGVVLLLVTQSLGVALANDEFVRDSGSGALLLSIVALVFLVIAVYVGAVVTTNTVATVIAGRTRTIALVRLIGSSAKAERRLVAAEGLRSGLIGSVIGVIAGVAIAAGAMRVAVVTGLVPELDYPLLDPVIGLPFAMVVLTTWVASWVGTRRVLDVTPLQAVSAAEESRREHAVRRTGRTAWAVVLFTIGTLLLALGMIVGLFNPLGVLIGVVGGMLSFTGVVLGAELVMPPALRLVGRMLGRGPTARLAAANAVRYPERSTRTTVGLVIAVTLVTMFAVTMESFRALALAAAAESPGSFAGMDEALSVAVGVFSTLIGFSAVVAATGMINNLSLSVLQRQRELGLLRALGFTSSQVRGMIVAEAAQLSVTAVVVGLALGIGYGWAGAQSLLGSFSGEPAIIAPTVPWALVAVLAGVAALLTLVASIAPSHRATRVTPVAALAAN
ncbi:MAG: ABC transporter permease [Cryobacterium sp.]|nr:ABC transporter permease [Cryobacterium sp.]